jgi:hypothetical protein
MIDDLYMMIELESSCVTPWDRSLPVVNKKNRAMNTSSCNLDLIPRIMLAAAAAAASCCESFSFSVSVLFRMLLSLKDLFPFRGNKIYKSKRLSLSISLFNSTIENRILSWIFLHTQDYSILGLFLHIIKDFNSWAKFCNWILLKKGVVH